MTKKSDEKIKPRVLFVCGASVNYPRNRLHRKFLAKNTKLIVLASGRKSYFMRFVEVFFRLPFYVKNADVFFVGWMGQPLVFLIRLLSKKPIVFDTHPSLYDSVCFDRKLARPGSLVCKLAFFLDNYAFRHSDVIFVSDQAFTDYIKKTFNVPNEKLERVILCADLGMFYPREHKKQQYLKDAFVVQYCGEFCPVHGVEYILRAAKLLERTNVIFKVAGAGQLTKEISDLYKELKPTNVELTLSRISDKELIAQKAGADLCLGAFGNTDKALRSPTNKAFESVAMARPLLTAGPPEAFGIGEFFTDNETAFFTKPADPQAIAEKILWIRDNPEIRERVARAGREHFMKMCNEQLQEQRVINSIVRVYGNW